MRRARAFGALGLWALEVRGLELAASHLAAGEWERRCELALALAGFLLLDIPSVRRHASDALRLAGQIERPDLEAKATAWLARCEQADGNIAAALDMDRVVVARAPGVVTATAFSIT